MTSESQAVSGELEVPNHPTTPPAPGRGVDFGPRLGARAIDFLTYYACLFAGGILVALPVALAAERAGHSGAAAVDGLRDPGGLALVLMALGSILAHAVAEGLGGASLGKRLLGFAVVGTHGRRAGFLAALKRSLAFLWDGLFFGLLAYQKMTETPLRQRYGDHWGETLVVHRRDLPAEARPSDARLLLALTVSWMASALLQAGGYLLLVAL